MQFGFLPRASVVMRLVLIANLVVFFSLGNYFVTKVQAANASAVAVSLLPADIADLALGYSIRRISSSYRGAAIRVRRARDNAQMDIGFDANGNLDFTLLKSVCAEDDCFVMRWYDQSGNNHHIYQRDFAKQPKIYDAKTGLEQAFKQASLLFDSLDSFSVNDIAYFDTELTNKLEIFLVAQNKSNAAADLLFLGQPVKLKRPQNKSYSVGDITGTKLLRKTSHDLVISAKKNALAANISELLIFNSDHAYNSLQIQNCISQYY